MRDRLDVLEHARVFERALIVERFVSARQVALRRHDVTAEMEQDARTCVAERTPPYWPGEAEITAATLPVNGLSSARVHQSIVFFSSGVKNELYSGDAISRAGCVGDQLDEFRRVRGHALAVFEVAMVERQRKIVQIEQGDFAASFADGLHGDGEELAIEGFAPRTAGEREDARWCGHGRKQSRTGLSASWHCGGDLTVNREWQRVHLRRQGSHRR